MDTNDKTDPVENTEDEAVDTSAEETSEAVAEAVEEKAEVAEEVEATEIAEAPETVAEEPAEASAEEAEEEPAEEAAPVENTAEAEEEEEVPQGNPNIPPFGPGDTVRVSAKVVEGARERIQAFEGVVMRIRSNNSGGNFTVRRVAHGVGVERTFLFDSPRVEKVEVKRRGKVRRANLSYLRNFKWKLPRIKEKRY